MKVLRAFLIFALFVFVATPFLAAAVLWFDAGEAIADAEQAGALSSPANDAPLSVAEHAIVAIEFGRVWNVRPAPCRAFVNLWEYLSGSDVRTLAGASPSIALATQMLNQQAPERTLHRQFRRVALACRLEGRFTDAQMLRAWLQSAYFGVEPFGIERASLVLFGKPAAALDAAESARLAALLRAPSLRRDPARWEERARLVEERVAAFPHP